MNDSQDKELLEGNIEGTISTYTSSVIMAAFKIGHLLKSVYQFSIGALYQFTSGSDKGCIMSALRSTDYMGKVNP